MDNQFQENGVWKVSQAVVWVPMLHHEQSFLLLGLPISTLKARVSQSSQYVPQQDGQHASSPWGFYALWDVYHPSWLDAGLASSSHC